MDKLSAIGVLAGMGPRSTAPFIDMLIDACQARYGARHDEDFPTIVAVAQPTPFRLDRPPQGEAMVAAMRSGLERLQQAGAAFVAMPCNIAHTWLSELSQASTVPIMDMIAETIGQVPVGARIALLATPATIESGLYQRRLREMDAALVGGQEWQRRVTNVIAAVKQGHLPVARDELAGLLQDMRRHDGVDLALCACTDLNPVMPRQPPLRVIDSARCLADAAVRRWLALSPAAPCQP